MSKQISIHGRKLFLDDRDILVAKAHGSGDADSPPLVPQSGKDIAALFDDFLGDTGDIRLWNRIDGDTGGHATAAIVAGNGGFVRFTMSNTNNPAPANVNGLGKELTHFKVQQGDSKDGWVAFLARVKIATVSRATPNRLHMFIGLSDSGGTEMPAYDTGAGIQAGATNAVGFVFGAGADTGWSGVGVNAGTATSPVVLDTGVTSNVWDELAFVINRGISDTGGSVTFFVNRQAAGRIASPVVTTAALTPVVAAFHQDTGGTDVWDVDYINAYSPRDTGE